MKEAGGTLQPHFLLDDSCSFHSCSDRSPRLRGHIPSKRAALCLPKKLFPRSRNAQCFPVPQCIELRSLSVPYVLLFSFFLMFNWRTIALQSLEKGMATHSSTLAWRIPWAGRPGGLQSAGLQRAGRCSFATCVGFCRTVFLSQH